MFANSFKRILIVSPHPDDSEYSCYGMIRACNSDVGIFLCSGGGKGDETNVLNRQNEFNEFWKNSKKPINSFYYLNFLKLDYSNAVNVFDSFLEENCYDAIITPSEFDTNQEHRFVSQVCKTALRNKSSAHIEYWTPSTTHEWSPNVWCDISNVFHEKKRLLLNFFKSQLNKSYFDEKYLDIFHQDWQAFKRGIVVCEKYKIISWISK